MNITTYAADIAKNVMQIHWHRTFDGRDPAQKIVAREVRGFFAASLRPASIGMEACGGAHHWARTFQSIGHDVELLP